MIAAGTQIHTKFNMDQTHTHTLYFAGPDHEKGPFPEIRPSRSNTHIPLTTQGHDRDATNTLHHPCVLCLPTGCTQWAALGTGVPAVLRTRFLSLCRLGPQCHAHSVRRPGVGATWEPPACGNT